MKPAQLALILGFALAGGLGGVLLGRHFALPSGPPLPEGTLVLEEGSKRPDAQLRAVDGSSTKLSAFDGRPLLINFWATWCPPCVKELPMLDALHQRSGLDGLQVIGIALDDATEVERFLGEVAVTFPMFLAEPGRVDLSTTLGNARAVLPYSVLIDAEGRIVRRKFGAFTEASLDAWVAGYE